MHYKNGREAKVGDPVIVKDYNVVRAGVIHSLIPGAEQCNAQVCYPQMGGYANTCVTVGNCWHAEDALVLAEAAGPASPKTQ